MPCHQHDRVALECLTELGAPTIMYVNMDGLVLTDDIIAGLNRVYALRGSFNIASVNMSLGGGVVATDCDDDALKPASTRPTAPASRSQLSVSWASRFSPARRL